MHVVDTHNVLVPIIKYAIMEKRHRGMILIEMRSVTTLAKKNTETR